MKNRWLRRRGREKEGERGCESVCVSMKTLIFYICNQTFPNRMMFVFSFSAPPPLSLLYLDPFFPFSILRSSPYFSHFLFFREYVLCSLFLWRCESWENCEFLTQIDLTNISIHRMYKMILWENTCFLKSFWQTPLHLAAYYGYKECVEKLLQYGANKSLKNVQKLSRILRWRWREILIWGNKSLTIICENDRESAVFLNLLFFILCQYTS